jgi:hypothetical protein
MDFHLTYVDQPLDEPTQPVLFNIDVGRCVHDTRVSSILLNHLPP